MSHSVGMSLQQTLMSQCSDVMVTESDSDVTYCSDVIVTDSDVMRCSYSAIRRLGSLVGFLFSQFDRPFIKEFLSDKRRDSSFMYKAIL